ncbi:MAG: hypothetical protein AB7K64_06270 [Variibacter sp.]
MNSPNRTKPFVELELRPVAAPACATPGAKVFMLLPTVDELLGVPAFGQPHPIVCPNAPLPASGWARFAGAPRHGWTLH